MKNHSSKSNALLGGASLKHITRAVLGVVVCGLLTQSAPAAAPPVPGNSHARGMSLAEWQESWLLCSFALPPDVPRDSLGNAVIKNTVLMPAPLTPGDGTPGTNDVTIRTGQGFVLGLWGYTGTSYSDGTSDDPAIPHSVFSTMDISFKIDGQVVVNSANVMRYYAEFVFDPPVAVPSNWAPMQALIWSQSITIVHPPLPPGDHTMTLDAVNTEPFKEGHGIDCTYEYHNTWNVHVIHK